jgi:hypothetical protein
VNIFGVIPLNPVEGMVVVDIAGGLRGRVPERDMVGFMDVTIVLRDGSGLGMAGELGL